MENIKQTYYQNHKEQFKEYYQTHKEQIKIYLQTHKEQTKKSQKNRECNPKRIAYKIEYRQTHKKEHNKSEKKYNLTHRKQIKKYNNFYHLTHEKQIKEQQQFYRLINKEQRLEWHRNHILDSSKLNNGKKWIKCNKRNYPLDNACQLCGKTNTKLFYHHWDNEHLEFGIWICNKCHWITEGLDLPNYEQLKNKYLNFKEVISHV